MLAVSQPAGSPVLSVVVIIGFWLFAEFLCTLQDRMTPEDKARVERWNWAARHVEQTEEQKRVSKEMLPWLARTGCLILLVHELIKRSAPTWVQNLLILPILGLVIVYLRKSKSAGEGSAPPSPDREEDDASL